MKDKISEEALGELIAALPPAPPVWVAAAAELPAVLAAIDRMTARAADDAEVRDAILAEPEVVLHSMGVKPRPGLARRLLGRLGRGP